jgi:hypothetical protein
MPRTAKAKIHYRPRAKRHVVVYRGRVIFSTRALNGAEHCKTFLAAFCGA